jgi:hypothetical protein
VALEVAGSIPVAHPSSPAAGHAGLSVAAPEKGIDPPLLRGYIETPPAGRQEAFAPTDGPRRRHDESCSGGLTQVDRGATFRVHAERRRIRPIRSAYLPTGPLDGVG